MLQLAQVRALLARVEADDVEPVAQLHARGEHVQIGQGERRLDALARPNAHDEVVEKRDKKIRLLSRHTLDSTSSQITAKRNVALS